MKQRLFITGGTGLLGLNWALSVQKKFDVTIGIHLRKIVCPDVKTYIISSHTPEFLFYAFNSIKPDLVIHTAGITSVEGCELSPEKAGEINTAYAAHIAQCCAIFDIPLIHISSDHLFSGHFPNLEETQNYEPINVYGKTKADAEIEVLKWNSKALILRTNFYGWGPTYRKSFSDFIIQKLRNGQEVTLFQDVFYTPIIIEELIRCAHDLVEKNAHGIFHVVGDERISKFEFGLKVATHFQLDKELIQAGSLKDNVSLVKRPMDMSLSNQKICMLLGRKLGQVDDHLHILKEQEKHAQVIEILNMRSYVSE